MDGDDDIGVLSASQENDKIVWYENISSSGVENQFGIQNYEFITNNFPNPFNNSTTTITFTLPQAVEISLKAYDIMGREVQALVTGHWSLGTHQVVWDAKGIASGVYFIRLTSGGGQSAVDKIVLMK